jgi:hypothetical protein
MMIFVINFRAWYSLFCVFKKDVSAEQCDLTFLRTLMLIKLKYFGYYFRQNDKGFQDYSSTYIKFFFINSSHLYHMGENMRVCCKEA